MSMYGFVDGMIVARVPYIDGRATNMNFLSSSKAGASAVAQSVGNNYTINSSLINATTYNKSGEYNYSDYSGAYNGYI